MKAEDVEKASEYISLRKKLIKDMDSLNSCMRNNPKIVVTYQNYGPVDSEHFTAARFEGGEWVMALIDVVSKKIADINKKLSDMGVE